MPTVNIFYTSDEQAGQVIELQSQLKDYFAKELSCGDISLIPEEVSIRLVKATNAGMIAELEVEVTVHAFDERVQKQDEIANNIRDYLLSKVKAQDIRVWVLLPQLGHSW
jgi:hypothetical protein